MRKAFGFSVIVAAFLMTIPHTLQAQMNERHEALLKLSLDEILLEKEIADLDDDALGHVFFRCGLIFVISGDVLAAAIPAESEEKIAPKVQQAKGRFEERAEQILAEGVKIIDLPPGQKRGFFKIMYETWSPDLTEGAIQMILADEEDADEVSAAQGFRRQLEICVEASNRL